MIGVNCGSGQRRFDVRKGWVNVDIVSREGQVPDLIADGRALPFREGSVDIVVLSHCLEHFHLGDSDGLVRESFRVLRQGGSLIVTSPDLKALARRWLLGEIDDYIFCVNVYGAWQGREGDDHHWNWSQEGLLKMLKGCAGWTMVRTFDWRQVVGMDLARDWWIASAECVR